MILRPQSRGSDFSGSEILVLQISFKASIRAPTHGILFSITTSLGSVRVLEGGCILRVPLRVSVTVPSTKIPQGVGFTSSGRRV